MSNDSDESTIENRVYLFKDMAASWLRQSGDMLTKDRASALKALADIAFVACTVADEEEMDPAELADAIARRGRA